MTIESLTITDHAATSIPDSTGIAWSTMVDTPVAAEANGQVRQCPFGPLQDDVLWKSLMLGVLLQSQ